MMTSILRVSLVLAFCAGGATGGTAGENAGDARQGEEIFQRYCTACHGLEGTGHGPMVTVLAIPPTDLSLLKASNGGEFPLVRVIRRIDGRDPLVSHGSPMPVYGDFFEGRDVMLQAETGQPIASSQPVADLVAYLKELQAHGD